MITPIEIRQHTFKKAFQGFNKDDVQGFLNTMAVEWERMIEDNKRLKIELEKTQSALDNLRQVESALHKTLLQAEETSRSTIENAKTTADLRIQEAEAKAKEMLKNALEDRSRIEMQTNELVARRNEILHQLKTYLVAQTERLKNFEEKEMKHAISSMPEARPVVEAPKEQREAPVQEKPNTVVEVKTPREVPQVPVAEAEKQPANDSEGQSFFEKSVASAPVSAVINDIADEL